MNFYLDDSNLGPYKFGRYSGYFLTGVFGLASSYNLVKFFSYNKNKMLRKKLEENLKVSFNPVQKGAYFKVNFGI
jgi:hypothetical protein